MVRDLPVPQNMAATAMGWVARKLTMACCLSDCAVII